MTSLAQDKGTPWKAGFAPVNVGAGAGGHTGTLGTGRERGWATPNPTRCHRDRALGNGWLHDLLGIGVDGQGKRARPSVDGLCQPSSRQKQKAGPWRGSPPLAACSRPSGNGQPACFSRFTGPHPRPHVQEPSSHASTPRCGLSHRVTIHSTASFTCSPYISRK